MDTGRRTGRREPGGGLAQRGGAGVAVDDHEGVRAVVAGRGGGDLRPLGVGPAGAQRAVVEPPHQFGRTRQGLVRVVREQQPAVLATVRTDLRQPAEPGPVRHPLLGGARPVRADQHDVEGAGGVQGGELGEGAAGQPGQLRPRSGEAEGARPAQLDGDRQRGPAAAAGGRPQADGQCVGVVRAALPEPRSRAQRGEQDRGGVRPPFLRGGPGERLRVAGAVGGVRAGGRCGVTGRCVRRREGLVGPLHGGPPACQPPRPGSDAAAPPALTGRLVGRCQ